MPILKLNGTYATDRESSCLPHYKQEVIIKQKILGQYWKVKK